MSSRKNNLTLFQNITAGDMTKTLTSVATNIQHLDNIGIQFNFTGTPTGNFNVQVSADYAQDFLGEITNAGNWINLTLSPSPAATGSASSIYIDLNQLSAPWLRVVYTPASGSGTLNAFVTAKMV